MRGYDLSRGRHPLPIVVPHTIMHVNQQYIRRSRSDGGRDEGSGCGGGGGGGSVSPIELVYTVMRATLMLMP